MSIPSRPLTALAALVLLNAGCRTTTVERVAPPRHAAVEEALASRTWDVVSGDETLGRIVEFRSDARGDEAQFVVQNVWQQDLGMIDGLGRAWRFRPHRTEAEWLLTGTIAQGAAAILDAEECELREVSLDRAREAAAQR